MLLATSHIEEKPIDIYSKRWEIETLFECLKGRGFNFEDTRLTGLERVNKMVAVLALSYCWAHKAGEWRSEQGDGLKYKKHGRLEKSLFRHGLDLLQQIMLGHSLNVIR
ncbi:MAG: transposase [Gammaproteobacteria bacterium]|nr:transposase [Gammaproteobacteria bacterium]